MIFFILLVTLLSNFHSLVSGLNSEGYVLLSFKNSIYQDPEGSLKNWNLSDEDPCSWNGVSCNDQKVVSLSIPKKKLFGSLSSSLGSLSNLRHLNLRNNRFFGSLPAEIFQAQGIQSLVLYGNSFSGSLPNVIGKLKYLQTLDLSQNFFNGSIPPEIVQCKRLRSLVLSQNNLTGSLPDGFGAGLVSLEKLDVSFNKFNGSIPNDIGNLTSLQGTVDFSHNLFSGSIPSSLGNLPEKVYIDLSYNNLSGAIPQNGALMNRGPTAFIGNPGLCGPPLKTPCASLTPGASSPSSIPYFPGNNPPQDSGYNVRKNEKGKGLSKGAVAVIIVCDVVGICLAGFLFSYCYFRICPSHKDQDGNGYGFEKAAKGQECLCFGRDECETLSENLEQHDLVPLGTQVDFDLDELLKASAFVLGKTSVGIVYKVVLEDGLTLAVRRLGEGGSQRFKEFRTEVEAIGKLKHPNIVTLRAYYWSVEEKLLIYDYVPNGSLATALHGKPGIVSFMPLSWSMRLKIIEGFAKGLVYLHEFSPKKYVHGDLKPNNILLGQNMEPRISDFGLSRLANIAVGSPTLQSNRAAAETLQERQQKITPGSEVATISSLNLGYYYQAPKALKVDSKKFKRLKKAQRDSVDDQFGLSDDVPDGEEKIRAICTLCGRIAYQNPKMVVGCLIEHDGKVLLCKRNIEPSFGLWTLPAGYLEIGESAAEGAMRETWEEARAEVEVLSPFAQLDIPLIGQTYIIFLAKLKKPHFSPGPESSECQLFSLEDIPFDSLAFSSMLATLNLYIEDVKSGRLKFHYGTINKRPGTSPSEIHAYTLDHHLQS